MAAKKYLAREFDEKRVEWIFDFEVKPFWAEIEKYYKIWKGKKRSKSEEVFLQ